jgi:hypothetical protein
MTKDNSEAFFANLAWEQLSRNIFPDKQHSVSDYRLVPQPLQPHQTQQSRHAITRQLRNPLPPNPPRGHNEPLHDFGRNRVTNAVTERQLLGISLRNDVGV